MNGTIHTGALTYTRALPEHVSTVCMQEHYLPVEAQIAWRRHTRALSMLRSSACPWEHSLHVRALPPYMGKHHLRVSTIRTQEHHLMWEHSLYLVALSHTATPWLCVRLCRCHCISSQLGSGCRKDPRSRSVHPDTELLGLTGGGDGAGMESLHLTSLHQSQCFSLASEPGTARKLAKEKVSEKGQLWPPPPHLTAG